MGHQVTIDDETFALATESVSLQGGSAEQVLAAVVRLRLDRERAIQVERERSKPR